MLVKYTFTCNEGQRSYISLLVKISYRSLPCLACLPAYGEFPSLEPPGAETPEANPKSAHRQLT